MDDDRIWAFEERLWTGDPDHYRHCVDDECVMVVPAEPFVLKGKQAIEAVAATPRWQSVDFAEQAVQRPQEGLIVIAYMATAKRDEGDDYVAYCSSTLRMVAHADWRVVQHSQTLPPVAEVTR